MKQLLKPGKYVVAVSGGVDSVVLLNMLSNYRDANLIIAHYDHGIREDSKQDREFVANLAKKYHLTFEYEEGHLGQLASEDTARQARYNFLRKVMKETRADAIVTAHHQDDVLETMVLNLMRGTGRKGLSSLSSSEEIIRPLLSLKKTDLIKYAKQHNLLWREDSTNNDERILRNWVRKNIIPKLSTDKRAELVNIYLKSTGANKELDEILRQLHKSQDKLPKRLVMQLPHKSATELLAQWLRDHGVRSFTKQQLEMILVGTKTLPPGKTTNIFGRNRVRFEKDFIQLIKE